MTTFAGSALTPYETRLVKELKFDADLMTRVKANGLGFERLEGVSADGKSYPAAGLLLVTEIEQAAPALQAIRKMLRDTSYNAYVNVDELGTDNDKIAIVTNLDEYAYLAVVRPSGHNEGVTFEQLLDKYRRWDRDFGLELIGAGPHWLEARTTRSPLSWVPAAREVQAMCRSCIGEGAETPEVLAEGMRLSRSFFLYWE
jgi:hypothetical protein